MVYQSLLRQATLDDEENSNDENVEDGDVNSSDEEKVNGVDDSSKEGEAKEEDDKDQETESSDVDGDDPVMPEELAEGSGVVAFTIGSELIVANAGASRCIVCREGVAIEMSTDNTLTKEQRSKQHVPDVKTLTIDPSKDEFMVLANDRIWNFMSIQDVCDFILPKLQEGRETLSHICKDLFDYCLALETTDDDTECENTIAMIVRFEEGVIAGVGQHPA